MESIQYNGYTWHSTKLVKHSVDSKESRVVSSVQKGFLNAALKCGKADAFHFLRKKKWASLHVV